MLKIDNFKEFLENKVFLVHRSLLEIEIEYKIIMKNMNCLIRTRLIKKN